MSSPLTPISSDDESTQTRGYQSRWHTGFGGPSDPWNYHGTPCWQCKNGNIDIRCASSQSSPHRGRQVAVFVPLRGKRSRDAPSRKGKNPAPKRRRELSHETDSDTPDSDSESEKEGDLAETFDPLSFYNKSSRKPHSIPTLGPSLGTVSLVQYESQWPRMTPYQTMTA